MKIQKNQRKLTKINDNLENQSKSRILSLQGLRAPRGPQDAPQDPKMLPRGAPRGHPNATGSPQDTLQIWLRACFPKGACRDSRSAGSIIAVVATAIALEVRVVRVLEMVVEVVVVMAVGEGVVD